jgi:hypothetical protein
MPGRRGWPGLPISPSPPLRSSWIAAARRRPWNGEIPLVERSNMVGATTSSCGAAGSRDSCSFGLRHSVHGSQSPAIWSRL